MKRARTENEEDLLQRSASLLAEVYKKLQDCNDAESERKKSLESLREQLVRIESMAQEMCQRISEPLAQGESFCILLGAENRT